MRIGFTQPLHDAIVTSQVVTQAYDVFGKAGPPVVLIHGWSGSRHYFERNAQVLLPCRLFTPFLRLRDQFDALWVCVVRCDLSSIQALARSCQVYCPDLRFHGDSGRPTYVRWDQRVYSTSACTF
jgi:pimeloyl-ACP methyl ester carboxylesterase